MDSSAPAATRTLILVKHAKAEPMEGLHPTMWRLSADGRAASLRLAERLRPFRPSAVFTSAEPKAAETGKVLADAFGVPAGAETDLREHDRDTVPIMPSREFISLMAHFFKQRNSLVLGEETAADATRRIVDVVDDLLVDHPTGNLVVITHGTVLALLLADRAQRDPFLTWRNMGQPSYATFEVPTWEPRDFVARLDEPAGQ